MVPSIVFLAVTLIISLGSAQSQQGNQPDNASNTCCQCASGIPGTPGTPGPSGHNGYPGRDGLRGEKGDPGLMVKGKKGDSGDRGVPGSEGQKGEIGAGTQGPRGLPGKLGPPGPSGERGSAGETGLAFAKGEKGGFGSPRKSAFTAIKTGEQTGVSGDIIRFDVVETNIHNDFSLETNKFTCRVRGTYVFMFSVGINSNTNPVVSLMKNGNSIVSIHSSTGISDFDMGGNSAIVNLAKGDEVWIQFAYYSDSSKIIYSNSYKYTTLSGFLLYEI